jgi:hypothetical protein
MIYVYAITDAPSLSPPATHGLEGRPLDVLGAGDVSAIYTTHEARRMEPSAKNLWRHEAVVEASMHGGTAVLPARFGTTFAGLPELRETLERHGPALAGGLARVQGCVELGLRVARSPEKPQAADEPFEGATSRPIAPAAPAAGRDYMRARLAEEQRRRGVRARAEALTTTVHEALAPLARDSTRQVLPRAGVFTVAAYLVHSTDVERFRARVRDLAAEHSDFRFLCTGPWPAYHFAPPLGQTEPANA